MTYNVVQGRILQQEIRIGRKGQLLLDSRTSKHRLKDLVDRNHHLRLNLNLNLSLKRRCRCRRDLEI
jgi:hypothetical protein